MEIIDKNLKVVLGQLIRVKNLNKKPTENALYVSLQVKDENGNNERCILLSEKEVTKLEIEKIKADFLYSNMKAGVIYRFIINNHETNLIKVMNYEKKNLIFKISNNLLLIAEKRALRNKEDLTKKGFFVDLFD